MDLDTLICLRLLKSEVTDETDLEIKKQFQTMDENSK